MNYFRFFLLSAAVVMAGHSALAGKAPANVFAIAADTVSASKIVYPESFETDTHKLMQNWYLTNYIQLDKDADKRPSKNYTEQDYIDRLQSLPTVIEMPYNNIVRAYIDMYCDRKKSLVETMLGMSLYYMPIFEEALDRNGLPMELKYLPVIESALNPNAVSRAGATGLWQFMMSTAKGEGLEVSSLVDERRDPYRSSEAAAKYLKKLYNTYGDWSLAIAAYNCGPGNVNKALRRAGGGKKDFWEIYPFLPSETRTYVPAFIAANYAMNFYNHHNISPALASRPIVTDSVHVNRRVHFAQISEVMGIPIDELRILNPQYRQDVIPGDIKPYPLVLPNIQAYCYIANEDSIVNHNAELYARRPVVEPSTGRPEQEVSGNGEYVTETVVKYHKVRRGETLSSIARRYGVSTKSIKRSNNLKRNKVRRGQTLRITTTQRRWVPSENDGKTEEQSTDIAQNNENVQDQNTGNELAQEVTSPSSAESAETHRSDKAGDSKKKEQDKKTDRKKDNKPKTITHKIAKGENLSKIAKKYGVSVDDIKKANNMKNDNIQIGQTLQIPSKNTSVSKSKSSGSKSKKSKKSKRRRRR